MDGIIWHIALRYKNKLLAAFSSELSEAVLTPHRDEDSSRLSEA